VVVDLTVPSAELLLRHSKAGPRYTSYPTVPVWKEDFADADYEAGLRSARLPASVYVHIPFCKEQCTFCGCNMVVSGRREPGTRYLAALEQQINALPLPAEKVDVVRIHLGGGTPTWLSVAELEQLYAMLYRRFRPVDGAEISVEADPEVTTDAQVEAMAALGVNRLSMGVQSFDPVVLAAVNRPQEAQRVFEITERSRALGMHSMNLDLIYGLPHQTPERFGETLRRTLEMRPDRLAVFGYAHVPWLKPHQNKLDPAAIPTPLQRVELFLLAHEMLTERGYLPIGLDHFALPDDELSVAWRERRLHRNFMGYTTMRDVPVIGLGMSAISELPDQYMQQTVRLSRWWNAVEKGESVVEKGCHVTAEDRLRRDVINGLMCNLEVRFSVIEERWGVNFKDHFADALAALEGMQEEGLVEVSDEAVTVTSSGRLLVRNVAMPFDAHLKRRSGDGPRFSQTV
jgi:oxygen-independent coproporphyrinogen III oxidase